MEAVGKAVTMAAFPELSRPMHHSTIRRAKAQVRAKDKNNDASTAGGAKPPLQPAVMHQLMQFRTIAGRRAAGGESRHLQATAGAVDADKLPAPA